MALAHWQTVCPAHPDVERGLPRAAEISGFCTAPHAPSAGAYAGLVLVLHGFGEWPDSPRVRALREYLAEQYGLLAVSVAWHAWGLQGLDTLEPGRFGRIAVRDDEFRAMLGVADQPSIDRLVGFARPVAEMPGWLQFAGDESGDGLQNFLSLMNQIIDSGVEFRPQLKVVADNRERQNFGVLQALDCLAVVDHLQAQGGFDPTNILLLGASHGGYLAHLCAKFAPNTFRGVIESSSYPAAPASLLADRVDARYNPYLGLSCMHHKYHVCFDSAWNLEEVSAPDYFSPARRSIRSFLEYSHWFEVAGKSRRKCQFRMLHSSQDSVFQPLAEKRWQVQALQGAGFSVQYLEAREEHIDGGMVRNLGHCMGGSLRRLFDHYYPTLAALPGMTDRELATGLSFDCHGLRYQLRHGDGVQMQVVKN